MKIAALGDAHVGRSVYPISHEGINVRERDFEESFLAAIELMLGQNPDLILLLGDVFDFPRPSYRSFRVIQKGLFVIRDSKVPLIAISGNHDTPRLNGTESPYGALHDVFPEFGLVYRQEYEYFDIQDVRIHGIPQMLAQSDTLEALEQARSNKSSDHANLIITHPRVRQLAPSYADINEIELDAEVIEGDFALLGHYHFHARVKENMWYVGSTDTFTFADNPELAKGIATLDTNSGTFTHVPIEGQRPLVDLGIVNSIGHGPKDIESTIAKELSGTPRGGIARLRLDGVDPGAFRLVDSSTIRELGGHLLHFRLEPIYLSSAIDTDLPVLESMPSRWERFVEQQDVVAERKSEIFCAGIDYINKAIESS